MKKIILVEIKTDENGESCTISDEDWCPQLYDGGCYCLDIPELKLKKGEYGYIRCDACKNAELPITLEMIEDLIRMDGITIHNAKVCKNDPTKDIKRQKALKKLQQILKGE